MNTAHAQFRQAIATSATQSLITIISMKTSTANLRLSGSFPVLCLCQGINQNLIKCKLGETKEQVRFFLMHVNKKLFDSMCSGVLCNCRMVFSRTSESEGKKKKEIGIWHAAMGAGSVGEGWGWGVGGGGVGVRI